MYLKIGQKPCFKPETGAEREGKRRGRAGFPFSGEKGTVVACIAASCEKCIKSVMTHAETATLWPEIYAPKKYQQQKKEERNQLVRSGI